MFKIFTQNQQIPEKNVINIRKIAFRANAFAHSKQDLIVILLNVIDFLT